MAFRARPSGVMSRSGLEVEVKFRAGDLREVAERLSAMGAVPLGDTVEVDAYFAHPCRDFASTDEALRVRYVGDSAELTYKGPRMGPRAKTRREVTVRVEGDVEALVSSLGFGKVAVVRKRRALYAVGPYTVSLDDVEGLGKFVEIEAVVAGPDDMESVVRGIEELAARLGLAEREDRTYLEILLSVAGRRHGH